MAHIAKLIKNDSSYKLIAHSISEQQGPSGNEGFCKISQDGFTAPYISEFKNLNDHGNIILSGDTYNINVPDYDDDHISISQYFLENRTRNDKLQYIIAYGPEKWKPIIPGLETSESKKPMCYVHNYLADDNGKCYVEIPFGIEDVETEPESIKSGNVLEFMIDSDTEVTIEYGDEIVEFKLYKTEPEQTISYKAKNINDFADYMLASNAVSGTNELLVELEKIDSNDDGSWFPTHFPVMKLEKFSDVVPNIKPRVMKIDAALVDDGNGQPVFMTNITGIAINKTQVSTQI